ncbi:hypothetical protein ACLNGM_09880 [Aureimonas phyllosphaerae]|uniref:hypothetical protein n=1 Tax=Aureimonas phyllosphaerae TaxID=1166078 RepID=UPI003A5C190B
MRVHQLHVARWMFDCFGPEISADKVERNDRFIEEALELAQSTGFTAERAHALVDYVFSRPAGEPGQEVGGVMVTLAALCNVHNLSISEEAGREVARITTPEMVAKIRAKQAAKPTGSALPMAVAAAPQNGSTRIVLLVDRSTCFDAIAAMNSDMSGIASRLGNPLLVGQMPDFFEALALLSYGIRVESVSAVAEPEARGHAA